MIGTGEAGKERGRGKRVVLNYNIFLKFGVVQKRGKRDGHVQAIVNEMQGAWKRRRINVAG